MMIKTSELIGAQLDWAVATCEGWYLCFEAMGRGCIVYKRVGDGGMLDNGAWVSCWMWVDFSGTPLSKEQT